MRSLTSKIGHFITIIGDEDLNPNSNPRNPKLQSKSKTQSPKDLVLQHAYFLRLSEAVDNHFCSIALEKIENKISNEGTASAVFLKSVAATEFY
jgi:hypothetical protein